MGGIHGALQATAPCVRRILAPGLTPGGMARGLGGHRAGLAVFHHPVRQRRDRAVRAQGVGLAALLAEVHRLPATTVGAEPRPLG